METPRNSWQKEMDFVKVDVMSFFIHFYIQSARLILKHEDNFIIIFFAFSHFFLGTAYCLCQSVPSSSYHYLGFRIGVFHHHEFSKWFPAKPTKWAQWSLEPKNVANQMKRNIANYMDYSCLMIKISWLKSVIIGCEMVIWLSGKNSFIKVKTTKLQTKITSTRKYKLEGNNNPETKKKRIIIHTPFICATAKLIGKHSQAAWNFSVLVRAWEIDTHERRLKKY